MIALLGGYFVVLFALLLSGSVEASVDWMIVGIVAVPLLMWGAIAAAAADDAHQALKQRRRRWLMHMRRLRDTDLREMYRNDDPP